MTLLLGLAGLAIDIGRMYVIRAELQSFTDAAALSAAMELNGTDSGLARARTGAGRLANGPHAMRWDMGTQPITNIATSFSSDNKTWQEQPKQAGDFRFVRVVATEPAPGDLHENLSAADFHHRRRRERGREDGSSP